MCYIQVYLRHGNSQGFCVLRDTLHSQREGVRGTIHKTDTDSKVRTPLSLSLLLDLHLENVQKSINIFMPMRGLKKAK